MLKSKTSPKSTRSELSNDTFAERKCCQVFAYESETFCRRPSNGISHCENGEQKTPKTSPSPCTTWTPMYNTAMHRPTTRTTQTAAATVEALLHTDAVESPVVTIPIGYNGAPQIRPKSTPSRGPIPKPHYLPYPWTVRPTVSNGCRIRSAVFPQCTGQTDRQTDRPTDR